MNLSINWNIILLIGLWLNDTEVKLIGSVFTLMRHQPSLTYKRMEHKLNLLWAKDFSCFELSQYSHYVVVSSEFFYSLGYHFVSQDVSRECLLSAHPLTGSSLCMRAKVIRGYRWIEHVSQVQWIDLKASCWSADAIDAAPPVQRARSWNLTCCDICGFIGFSLSVSNSSNSCLNLQKNNPA